MKLNTKITTVILEIALIPLLLMGFIGYSSFTIDHSRQVIFALDAIAQIQKSRIQEELREKEDLLRLFVAGTPLRAHVLEYVAGPSAETQKNIYDDLASGMGSVDGIQKAYVADTAGVIFSSTDSSLIGKNIAAEDYYRLGIQRNDTTTLRRNGQTNALLQYLAGPIMVGGKTVAVVVIAVGANDIVSVIQDYAGLGNTGETLLVKKGIGGNALFMAPTRFDSQAALTRVTVKGNTGDPSLRAVEGEEVVVASATDYRGSPILAVTRYVEDAGWGIVVKIDKSQAMKETNNILWLFWFIVLIAGLLILFVGASISRSISSPLLELTRLAKRISQGDLSQSVLVVSRDETGELGRVFNKMTDTLRGYQYGLEKKIEERTAELQKKTDFILQEKAKDEAILGSIGEGVIVTSEEGRVLFMNAFALSVLGLKEKNSRGKFVPELFEITNEGGEKLSKDNCPVARVIIRREKFSTSDYYYSRPGQTRFPVTITVAPVILNGLFIGVIEVFRDITKEKDIDKAKTEFVSLASHQLRSPLSIIKWYAEMLLSGGAMKLR
ncbi:MAG: HAMP domain-containing protein, partial [Candidatus Uhrbacteria bacterium]|nr:HAMP domain-containing protein [Candidatus Uhrbacteria bacterium]